MRPRSFIALLIGVLVAGCGNPTADGSPATSFGTPVASTTGAGGPSDAPPIDTMASAPPVPLRTSDPTRAADVSGYRGDSARSGVMPGPGPVAAPVVRWSFQAPAPIGSQPTVSGDRVFVVAADGTIVSLHLATGTTVWTAHLGVDTHGSPAVSGGLLLVGADDGAHGVAIDTGASRWVQTAPGVIRGAPAIAGDVAVFASTTGRVVGLDTATGTVRWTAPLGGSNDTSVAAVDGVAVVGTTGGEVVAVDTSTGAARWRTTIDIGARIGTPAIADGRVLLASLDGGGRGTRHITALDLVTGQILWRFDAPGDRPSYTPAVAGGLAITEGEDGVVTALDEATGGVRWQAREPGVLEIVATVVGGTMYGASNGNSAFALGVSTGRDLWRLPIKGVPYAPAITGGFELLPTNTGMLYAIGGLVP